MACDLHVANMHTHINANSIVTGKIQSNHTDICQSNKTTPTSMLLCLLLMLPLLIIHHNRCNSSYKTGIGVSKLISMTILDQVPAATAKSST